MESTISAAGLWSQWRTAANSRSASPQDLQDRQTSSPAQLRVLFSSPWLFSERKMKRWSWRVGKDWSSYRVTQTKVKEVCSRACVHEKTSVSKRLHIWDGLYWHCVCVYGNMCSILLICCVLSVQTQLCMRVYMHAHIHVCLKPEVDLKSHSSGTIIYERDKIMHWPS